MPRLRTVPEDFVVEEVPLYEPSDRGPYTAVLVEKRELDTEEVARRWAAELGVRSGEIGFAGRKDRRAIARQWLTVPGLAPEAAARLEGPGIRVLDARRHAHRLRPGDLLANRFEVVVREVSERSGELALERLAALERLGLENRFGAQRFGRDGRNARLGEALVRGERVSAGARHRRFLVAAFQAELFHRVLEARPVQPGRLLPGDVVMLHGSGRLTSASATPEEQERADRLELSPTGPLFGEKMRRAGGEPGELEERVRRGAGWPADGGREMHGLRIRGARRPLRVPVGRARGRLRGDRLELAFELPAGSYATVLVAALFDETVAEGGDDV